MIVKHRGRILHALATAFLLTSSMTAVTVVAAQAAMAQSNDDYVDQFYAAGYANCDAEKLGYYWRISMYDAKIRAGWKIWNGDQYVLDAELGNAISQFYCVNSGFLIDDATKLAALWTSGG